MELIKYLNAHFITRAELLELTQSNDKTLNELQQLGLMPQCSYRLKLNLESDSFFGLHHDAQELEYYAKGYISWLTEIRNHKNRNDAYKVFAARYEAAVSRLKDLGHTSNHPKVNERLAVHIEEEWSHFLKGIYGLCTKSGLPEDIAAKELAICEINELIETDSLNQAQLVRLQKAVNLLDSVSSLFAPHERLKSSRRRLVDEVRRRYRLQGN